MDKGRGDMKVKLYYQIESLGRERGGKNSQGGTGVVGRIRLRRDTLSKKTLAAHTINSGRRPYKFRLQNNTS